MVQPLAIILNDRVVVGAQLEQKLEELDYRVKVSDNPDGLTDEQVTSQVSEMALFFLKGPTPGGPDP